MKKLLMMFLVGVFVGFVVLPGPAAANVQFGIKFGGNIAKLTGADLDDIEATLKSKVGFVGGIFLTFNLGKILAIQTEVLYTMKGATYDYSDLQDPYIAKLTSDYLEIPLLLKIRIPLPLIQPFVFAGPAVGFRLSQKIESDGPDIPPDDRLLKNNDYGAIVGAGVNLGHSFMLDVRYSQGLQKAIDIMQGDADLDLKQGVWSATIGIAF